MASQKEFKHESIQDVKSITKYLDELSKGIANNELLFSNSEEQVVLSPNGLIDFELRVKTKNDKTKLEIRLSWSEKESKLQSDSLLINSNPTGNVKNEVQNETKKEPETENEEE